MPHNKLAAAQLLVAKTHFLPASLLDVNNPPSVELLRWAEHCTAGAQQ